VELIGVVSVDEAGLEVAGLAVVSVSTLGAEVDDGASGSVEVAESPDISDAGLDAVIDCVSSDVSGLLAGSLTGKVGALPLVVDWVGLAAEVSIRPVVVLLSLLVLDGVAVLLGSCEAELLVAEGLLFAELLSPGTVDEGLFML
jgi:hypothetical protein